MSDVTQSTTLPATLGAVLEEHVRHRAEHQLVIAPETERAFTYGELAAQARLFDAWLTAANVPRGARVALFLPNGAQAALLFLATMVAGRVTVPLNLLSTPVQLRHALVHSDAAVLFTCSELLPRVEEIRAELAESGADLRIMEIDPDAAQLAFATEVEPVNSPETSADDVALLMYTSGTTGLPKGVPLTHANLLHAARSMGRWHSLTPEDRVLSALPLYHINGQVIGTLTPFCSGGSIVAPRKFSASQWWGLVEKYHCTWLNMVPTIIAYLLNAPAEHDRAVPWVRFGRSASAPLPVEHHRAFEQRFGVPVIEGMGMTETASMVFCNPHEPGAQRYGSPGLPCGVEARIIGSDGEPVADGVTGEIAIRGANVMHGYHKNPEETARTIDAGGWLHSGDLGHRDADGYFFITGRIKELIIKGGENIAPREIDEVLLQHPAVLEAAAIGLPDPNYGQEIHAAVVLKPESQVSEEELRSFCVQRLGKYKTPQGIRFLDDLPKGPSGKVQRLKIVEQW
jgi:acyl-CoA synthetase (AMP-forming)/AMP-acid ligase II